MKQRDPQQHVQKRSLWLCGLEFMSENRPGFWEIYGYHLRGDPLKEERFGTKTGGVL